MIMDATLPDLPVLQAYYPQVQLVADIKAKMPEGVFIRQLVKAPVSKRRLITPKRDTNRNELRRYILWRWIETGRQRTLVISQLEFETGCERAAYRRASSFRTTTRSPGSTASGTSAWRFSSAGSCRDRKWSRTSPVH